MAIVEVRPLRRRNKIGWYGSPPDDTVVAIFRERDFVVEPFRDADFLSADHVDAAAAVIFVQDPNKAASFVGTLDKYGKALLDKGCLIFVTLVTEHRLPNGGVVSFALPVARVIGRQGWPIAGAAILSPGERSEAGIAQHDDAPLPHVRLFRAGTAWHQVANAITASDHDFSPNTTLRIEPSGLSLDADHEVLVRRAFADCLSVHLVPMDEAGKSGAKVFRAYADLQTGHLGPWPQPYFVKLGPREKIIQEYQHYLRVVDPYVPFHLGPRLITERCYLGALEGVIVGDFVNRAESLRECAARDRASHAIASLFHSTLHGWYRWAKEVVVPLTQQIQMPRFRGMDVRLNEAELLGAHKRPEELRELFAQSQHCLPVLSGPIHGDLHASNILVRGHDAILIDFFAHKEAMPLLFDVACLEASLLIDGFASDDRDIDQWLESVRPLYMEPLLLKACATTHPKEPSCWFYHCANQLRIVARDFQRCEGQYAAILAIALLRKASKDLKLKGKDSQRRAAAYVIAETLLVETFGRALAALKAKTRVRTYRRQPHRIDCIRHYGK